MMSPNIIKIIKKDFKKTIFYKIVGSDMDNMPVI